jgi:hypothetical protein
MTPPRAPSIGSCLTGGMVGKKTSKTQWCHTRMRDMWNVDPGPSNHSSGYNLDFDVNASYLVPIFCPCKNWKDWNQKSEQPQKFWIVTYFTGLGSTLRSILKNDVYVRPTGRYRYLIRCSSFYRRRESSQLVSLFFCFLLVCRDETSHLCSAFERLLRLQRPATPRL